MIVNNNNEHMTSFLSYITPGSNPFLNSSKHEPKKYIYPKFDTIIHKNIKAVRSPICLGIAMNAVHSNACKHIFCKFYNDKWKKIKRECPLCKQSFKNLIKLTLEEEWIEDQCDLFI